MSAETITQTVFTPRPIPDWMSFGELGVLLLALFGAAILIGSAAAVIERAIRFGAIWGLRAKGVRVRIAPTWDAPRPSNVVDMDGRRRQELTAAVRTVVH